jgi:hypothetical protein
MSSSMLLLIITPIGFFDNKFKWFFKQKQRRYSSEIDAALLRTRTLSGCFLSKQLITLFRLFLTFSRKNGGDRSSEKEGWRGRRTR